MAQGVCYVFEEIQVNTEWEVSDIGSMHFSYDITLNFAYQVYILLLYIEGGLDAYIMKKKLTAKVSTIRWIAN